jgi:hypothetical protein
MELNNSRLRSSCAFGTPTWPARRAPSLLDVATNLPVETPDVPPVSSATGIDTDRVDS